MVGYKVRDGEVYLVAHSGDYGYMGGEKEFIARMGLSLFPPAKTLYLIAWCNLRGLFLGEGRNRSKALFTKALFSSI